MNETELLNRLDRIARDYSPYEYGLPINIHPNVQRKLLAAVSKYSNKEIDRLRAELEAERNRKCEMRYSDDFDYLITGCGHKASDHWNDYNYCPICGGRL